MTKRATTMVRGYARRMAEIARLATEMKNIDVAYTKMMGRGISDEDLEQVLTGDRLATLAAEMAAERPAAPQEFEQDVLEGYGDPAPAAPGSALGLAPAPAALVDAASMEPVKWGHPGPPYRGFADDTNDRLPADSPLRLENQGGSGV